MRPPGDLQPRPHARLLSAELDLTFGPEIRYQSVTAGMKQNLPPTEGKQYFGAVRIEGATEVMTVSLHDVKGDTLFRVSLDPEA